MKKEKMQSQIEVFICNHKRENKEDCFHKGSKELTDELKKWAREQYGKDVRVFRSGCLGKCEEGIAVASYPDKQLFTHVTKEDSETFKQIIRNQVS